MPSTDRWERVQICGCLCRRFVRRALLCSLRNPPSHAHAIQIQNLARGWWFVARFVGYGTPDRWSRPLHRFEQFLTNECFKVWIHFKPILANEHKATKGRKKLRWRDYRYTVHRSRGEENARWKRERSVRRGEKYTTGYALWWLKKGCRGIIRAFVIGR